MLCTTIRVWSQLNLLRALSWVLTVILLLIAIHERKGRHFRGLESGQLRKLAVRPSQNVSLTYMWVVRKWYTYLQWKNKKQYCQNVRGVLLRTGVLILPSQLLCLFEDGLPTKCVFFTSCPFPKVENTVFLSLVTLKCHSFVIVLLASSPLATSLIPRQCFKNLPHSFRCQI